MSEKEIVEDVCLLNTFTSYDKAKEFITKFENPDDLGILTMYGRGISPDLHHVVHKRILMEFMK